MNRKLFIGTLCTILVLLVVALYIRDTMTNAKSHPIGVAVEFNDHAASAYVALNKGWYGEEGLNLTSFESYVTGVALAAALARGDIQAAYLCLGPALLVYSRGVPIKIVAGTHLYGYGLVARPEIGSIRDLEGKKIGCVREGSQCDLLLHILIERYDLDVDFERDIIRANPPKLVMLLKAGEIDAAIIPEHHTTLAESLGFKMLVESRDLWVNMQGSVLVVKADLIENSPEIVERLVEVTRRGTDYVNAHRDEAAYILTEELMRTTPGGIPSELITSENELMTPELMNKSMGRLEYTDWIDPKVIQDYVELLLSLGYIDEPIKPEDILDLRFCRE
jgi:NitT/TauT family transport system substrate-binding protein